MLCFQMYSPRVCNPSGINFASILLAISGVEGFGEHENRQLAWLVAVEARSYSMCSCDEEVMTDLSAPFNNSGRNWRVMR